MSFAFSLKNQERLEGKLYEDGKEGTLFSIKETDDLIDENVRVLLRSTSS